jgi:hypothetical protein
MQRAVPVDGRTHVATARRVLGGPQFRHPLLYERPELWRTTLKSRTWRICRNVCNQVNASSKRLADLARCGRHLANSRGSRGTRAKSMVPSLCDNLGEVEV